MTPEHRSELYGGKETFSYHYEWPEKPILIKKNLIVFRDFYGILRGSKGVAYKGTFLLQETKASAAIRQIADQVPASAAQIKKVATLLAGIKKDVQGTLSEFGEKGIRITNRNLVRWLIRWH